MLAGYLDTTGTLKLVHGTHRAGHKKLEMFYVVIQAL